jgi:hypothetical protein
MPAGVVVLFMKNMPPDQRTKHEINITARILSADLDPSIRTYPAIKIKMMNARKWSIGSSGNQFKASAPYQIVVYTYIIVFLSRKFKYL